MPFGGCHVVKPILGSVGSIVMSTMKLKSFKTFYFSNLFKFLRFYAVGLFALFAMAAQATVVITNTPNGTPGGTTVTDADSKALMFTSGAVPSTVNLVRLGLNPPGSNTNPVPAQGKVEIALFSVVAGIPSDQLATTGLLDVNIQQRQQMYDFNINPVFNLNANTPYALVVRSDSIGIKWGYTGHTGLGGTEPSGLGGFVYETMLQKDGLLGNWAPANVRVNAVEIHATLIPPVPTLAEWAIVLLASFMAFVAWRSRRQWANHRS